MLVRQKKNKTKQTYKKPKTKTSNKNEFNEKPGVRSGAGEGQSFAPHMEQTNLQIQSEITN